MLRWHSAVFEKANSLSMVCDGKEITAVILCGGQGRRMGNRDKGLIKLAGKAAIEHVLVAIEGQVDRVIINANRNIKEYESYGFPVFSDQLQNYQGPLAGIATALKRCQTPLLTTFPCDCPTPPKDIVARQCAALSKENADLATVREGKRLQPVFCLVRRELLSSLEKFLRSGKRKIDQWFKEIRVAEAYYKPGYDHFANINDPESQQRIAQSLLKS